MTQYVQRLSVRLATAMDRRQFIRRTAGGTFASITALAAGRLLSPGVAFAYPSTCEPRRGSGCPAGCGPSTACSVLQGGCHCSNGNGGCASGTKNCKGNYNDWGSGTNCWTCQYNECIGTCTYRITTTCCDCATSGCGKPPCIAYKTTTAILGGNCGGGKCGHIARPGEVVGVATGDPTTSWGMQPELGPVD
jgi:hypothetical protein